jgi:hypothetical protein
MSGYFNRMSSALAPTATVYRSREERGGLPAPRSIIWLPYFAMYFFCAIFFQVLSGLDPLDEASPLEDFTLPLLWMLSVVCVLISECYQFNHWRNWMWILGAIFIGFVALDESFQFHERTAKIVGDDDHMKVAEWFIAIIGIGIIHLISVPCSYARKALLIGFLFHTCYILVDVGDGDYYTLPFGSVTQWRWIEELLELTALINYTLGMLSLHLATRDKYFEEAKQGHLDTFTGVSNTV